METEAHGALTIAELAARAEVTPRTVRYYVSEGLLPAPGGSGQQRVYGYEHLLRLHAIRRLKDRYLPLGEIRERLAALSLAELEELVQAPPEPEPSSAFDYITTILANTVPPRETTGAQSASYAPPPASAPLPSSTPPLPAPMAAPASTSPPPQEPPQAPSTPTAGSPEPPSNAHPALQRQRRDAPAPPAQSAPPPSLWQRVALAPGVELHYQLSGDQARDSTIARLIGAATRLFSHPAAPEAPDSQSEP